MHGAWITGAEIMQKHGARALEIGQACYDGTLHAFTEAGTPIMEETKIAKIPKFPPPTADPLEHIQYSCRPSWDWIAQIRNPYKNDYLINQDALNYARDVASGVWGEGAKIFQKLFYQNDEALAARQYMRACFDRVSDDTYLSFCFRLDDYADLIGNDSGYALSLYESSPDKYNAFFNHGEPTLTRDEAFPMYENDIKAMLFQRSEVDAWMQQAVPAADGAQGEVVPQVDDGASATPMPQGDSMPAIDKNTPIQEASQIVIAAIKCGNYLDVKKEIGPQEFLGKLQDTMHAHGTIREYRVKSALSIYAKSAELHPFKRKPGHKKPK